MVVIAYKTIKEFGEKYPDAIDSLNIWYEIMEKHDFSNFNELRLIFNSVDAVEDDLCIFNIKGNHYRLIVRIIFRVRTVFIKFIGTHTAYDKINLGNL